MLLVVIVEVFIDFFVLLEVLSGHCVPSRYAGDRTSEALPTGDVHTERGSSQERRPVPQHSNLLVTLGGEGQEHCAAAAECHPRYLAQREGPARQAVGDSQNDGAAAHQEQRVGQAWPG